MFRLNFYIEISGGFFFIYSIRWAIECDRLGPRVLRHLVFGFANVIGVVRAFTPTVELTSGNSNPSSQVLMSLDLDMVTLDQGTLPPAFFEVIRIYILQAERWFLPNSRAVEAMRKTSRSGCTPGVFRGHFCMENLDQKFQGMWQQ